jgi:Lon-like ATP-dependent protease
MFAGPIRAVTCRRTFASLLFLHQSRSFVFSAPTRARRSNIAHSPRWVNPKSAHGLVSSQHPDHGIEQKDSEAVRLEDSEDRPSSSSSADPPSSSGSSDSSDPPRTPPSDSPPSSSQGSIAKQSIPDVYPQVLALPIARRPLFPGFYKAVVVRNPAVVSAIKEMMKRGQPYVGAFLLKEDLDSDVITDINSVHPVGVFAQITSVFAAGGKDDDREEGLTAVLYPHRRIKITRLLKAGNAHVEPTDKGEQQLSTPPPSPQEELMPIQPSESPSLLRRCLAHAYHLSLCSTPDIFSPQIRCLHCPS